jgi:hypothetical protein
MVIEAIMDVNEVSTKNSRRAKATTDMVHAVKVASDAYLLMLQMPVSGLRMRNQRVMSQTRDFIAASTGREPQAVQEEYEDLAAELLHQTVVTSRG